MFDLAAKHKLLRHQTEGFVFLAGFSMMVVELLAAKVSSPYIGSSLYTWTSVIGVILLGVTLGAWFGGRLSDRFPAKQVMALAFFLSGLLVIASYVMASGAGSWVISYPWPLWLMSFLFCVFVFLPAAVTLSAIQPAAVKSKLASMESAATTYGTLGAWNAAGSIIGVYAAGFIFEAFFSVRLVWFVIAALLLLIGIFIYVRDRLSR